MSEVNVPQGQIVRRMLATSLMLTRLEKNPSIASDSRFKAETDPEEKYKVVCTILHERSNGKVVRDRQATTLLFKNQPTLFTQGIMSAFKVDRNGAETIVRQAADDGHVIIEERDGNLSVRLEEKKVPTASSNGNSKLDKLQALMSMAGIG